MSTPKGQRAFDVAAVRADFPALASGAGRRLVYLDSAATSLKPASVIDAVARCQRAGLGAPGRGVHALAARSTEAYGAARAAVARHFNADAEEVVFVRGTTEALNLVAASWARPRLQAGDEVLVSELEHHSNFLPWQRVCEATGARLVIAPIDDAGRLPLEAVTGRISPNTRLVAVAHVSNVIGSVQPVAEIVAAAHAMGAVVVVDGAQAAGHKHVDFAALGCDFYAFSGHKLYAPDGIGVLLARSDRLSVMDPYQVGGGMVSRVAVDGSVYQAAPARFEAGTPSLSGAIGLSAALDYVDALGRDAVVKHERALVANACERLSQLPGVSVLNAAPRGGALLSFVVDGVHAHDVGSVADAHGVALRTGHHCAQPLMKRLGLSATVRASFGVYNDLDDVDVLLDAVQAAIRMLG